MAQMTEPIVAIIPARGGSKGLPRKNILDLGGKPLIAWSIEACNNARSVGDVWVTSDCKEILEVSSTFGANTLKRPGELAQDTTLTIPVIEHALDSLELGGMLSKYKYFALIQPTSPLRTARDIDNAHELLLNSNANSVISVQEVDRSVLKSFVFKDGGLSGIHNDDFPFYRRQDLPPVYKPNGAIYLVDIAKFLKRKTLMPSPCIPYVMDECSSLDIDNREDFQKAAEIVRAGSD